MNTTTVRISKETYERLDQLRGKGETFDDVVNRLVIVKEELEAITEKLEQRTKKMGAASCRINSGSGQKGG